MNEKEIRAVYNDKTIRIYQAYSKEIAQEAVRLGTFGSHFKKERMTWIKPSFLWMMYRCGWGVKENQEHILAIDIRREGFDCLVKSAVPSTYSEKLGISMEEWHRQMNESPVRVQWDPERDIYGNPLDYRSIQIGLRGTAVEKYVNEWIVKIEDITDYVIDLREKRDAGEDISLLLPKEQIYLKDKMFPHQEDFFYQLAELQKENVEIALCKYKDGDDIEDVLYETTYDLLVDFMTFLDGYSGTSDARMDIINCRTGNRLREPFLEFHDVVCDYIKTDKADKPVAMQKAITTYIPILEDKTPYCLYLVMKEDKYSQEELRAVSKLCGVNFIEASKMLNKRKVLLAEGNAYDMKHKLEMIRNYDVEYQVIPPFVY